MTIYSTCEQIAIILEMPEATHNARAEARIALAALLTEEMRHNAAKIEIRDRLRIEAWHHIERHWTSEEIAAAYETCNITRI